MRAPFITLINESDFWLGAVRIVPSTREIICDDTVMFVQPRVMQVLVCLAQAGGRVVSRDLLIERCWGGRIVSEDAIQRCIAQLRIRSKSLPKKAFSILTVSRVGYQLRLDHDTGQNLSTSLRDLASDIRKISNSAGDEHY